MSNRQRPHRSYQEQIVDAVTARRIPIDRGMVAVLDVEHEPHCPRPDGGRCTCRPQLGTLTYPNLTKGQSR